MNGIIQTAEEARIQYLKERNLWSEKNGQYLSEVNKAIQQANKEGLKNVVIDIPEVVNVNFFLSLLRDLGYKVDGLMQKIIIGW